MTAIISVLFALSPAARSGYMESGNPLAAFQSLQMDRLVLEAPLSRATWRNERTRLIREWDRILGLSEVRLPGAAFEVLDVEYTARFTRKRIRYRTEPDTWVEAYLLVPTDALPTTHARRRRPGVIVFHSTIDYTIRQPAGLEGPADKHIAARLAERGFVVLCPRCYIYDYHGTTFTATVESLRSRHPGLTGMGKMLLDARRAMEVLAAMPEVDSKSLGVIGHSLGAKQALYATAFDERVRAAVFSEGGIGLKMSNWDASWYLGDQINRADFHHDHSELLALCAPRPFLLIGGDSADGVGSLKFVDASQTVYSLYKASDRISMVNHHLGHAFPPEAQAEAYGWLERWLKPNRR